MKIHHLLFLFLPFLCCEKEGEPNGDTNVNTNPPNILLIIADDMGKDATPGFSEGSIKPNTPNIDALRQDGLVFQNFWSYPTCSPTRSAIITGKYGYRTGVKQAGDVLSISERTLQRHITEEAEADYTTAIVGKWHLSGEEIGATPEAFGIDHYVGIIRGAVVDYYNWRLAEDGTSQLQTDYTSKVFTDHAIDWVGDQSEPWFLWLAYNAPHTPYHVPPAEMHSQGTLEAYVDGTDPTRHYMAAIEAVDYQIGRLLEAIPAEERDNTIIIFIGDNGTPILAAQSPYTGATAKGTLYQGGVNVPMIISGAGVDRSGTDDNLVSCADLYSTIAELAGLSVSEIHDSKSFKSLLTSAGSHRDFQYAESATDTEERWAISDGRFKLHVNSNGEEELYDLDADPYEGDNLLTGSLSAEAESAKADLEAELLEIRN
ncbi:MAG: sulfatase-like hydrolase/transferase [Bacteroidota bacterium]